MNKPIAKLNDTPVRRGGDVLLEVVQKLIS